MQKDTLYVTYKQGNKDKYMFCPTNQNVWLQTLTKDFGEPTIDAYRWKTKSGTIILYPTTNVCVIHGNKTKRERFLDWFSNILNLG